MMSLLVGNVKIGKAVNRVIHIIKGLGVHLNVKGSYHHDQIHTQFLAKILVILELRRKIHIYFKVKILSYTGMLFYQSRFFTPKNVVV